MNTSSPAPLTRRRRSTLIILGTLAVAAIITVVVSLGAAASGSASSRSTGAEEGEVTAADGMIAGDEPLSVFDDSAPAIANFDDALLAALRSAARDARADGIDFSVNSGWRSENLQAQLLQEAIVTYGTEEEAARWVATPESSSHVTGDAIDLGPWKALDWLAQHGSRYDLCQIYANESWHYELRPGAAANGCPLMYDDAADDPRMQ